MEALWPLLSNRGITTLHCTLMPELHYAVPYKMKGKHLTWLTVDVDVGHGDVMAPYILTFQSTPLTDSAKHNRVYDLVSSNDTSV